MKRYAFLLLLIFLFLTGCSQVGASDPTTVPGTSVPETTAPQTFAAPDFTVYDIDGNSHRLSDFQGKPVILNFWASWCGPCRQEMPEVKKIYEQYKDKGFDIVGVSLDNNKKAWVGAINKMELPWHHISDLKGWQCEGAAVYGINAIPATILYGPDGKVVAAGLRAHELAEKLAEVLK